MTDQEFEPEGSSEGKGAGQIDLNKWVVDEHKNGWSPILKQIILQRPLP